MHVLHNSGSKLNPKYLDGLLPHACSVELETRAKCSTKQLWSPQQPGSQASGPAPAQRHNPGPVRVKGTLFFPPALEAAEACLGESKAGDGFQPMCRFQGSLPTPLASPNTALQVIHFSQHFFHWPLGSVWQIAAVSGIRSHRNHPSSEMGTHAVFVHNCKLFICLSVLFTAQDFILPASLTITSHCSIRINFSLTICMAHKPNSERSTFPQRTNWNMNNQFNNCN